jgi:DNA-binding GntR family transcriptional regulator
MVARRAHDKDAPSGSEQRRYGRLFQTKSDTIADLIQQDIVEGRLLPGTRLLQDEVAARYGSSTTPVREAFHKLESTGLVIRHPHRGHLVASKSVDEIDDVWRVRALVEGLEAELAAPHMTEDVLAELRRLADEMKAVGADLAGYARLNMRFHDTIYRTTSRPTLYAISKGLRDPSFTLVGQYLESGGNLDTLYAEHEAILVACEARDPVALKAAVQAHIDNARERVLTHSHAASERYNDERPARRRR